MDGGDLVMCDLCGRAICTTRCMTLPIDFETLRSEKGKDYSFACPTCHNNAYRKKLEPYFVSSFVQFD